MENINNDFLININFDEITYIKYLNKLVVKNPSIRDLKTDKFYLFIDEKEKRQVILQYKYTYPEKNNLKTFEFKKGIDIFDYSNIFIFAIVKDFPIDFKIEKYMLSLNGFLDVIDDRNYVYDIPLVNEIFHNDNFVISNTNIRLCYEKGDTIDDFNLTYETFLNPCVEILGYYDKHHRVK